MTYFQSETANFNVFNMFGFALKTIIWKSWQWSC